MSYIYGRTIEPYKKACHYAVVFDDWSLIEQLCPEIYVVTKEVLNGIQGIQKRRLAFGPTVVKELKRRGDWDLIESNPLYKSVKKRNMERLESIQSLQSLERLERIQSLERLQSLQSLESLQSLQSLESLERYSTDYQNIKIDKDSVIYCDIPYKNTDKYNNMEFDYERFYAWCERQTEPLFISSYEMPEDRFVCIASFEHRSTLCATANNKVIEKVFIPKHQAKDYRVPGLLFELQ